MKVFLETYGCQMEALPTDFSGVFREDLYLIQFFSPGFFNQYLPL